MAKPSWLQKAVELDTDLPAVSDISFLEAKKFFAVDASGSTMGGIMKAQERAVLGLHGNGDDRVVLWNTSCTIPRILAAVESGYFFGSGGTAPDCILKEKSAVDQIQDSDLWVLLTDGEIATDRVSMLTQCADISGVIQIPVVLIVTGPRYSGPNHANISVGIPFFASAQEALILFKDYTTGQIFVIDAKGAFEPLKPKDNTNFDSWDSLPTYANEADFNKHCAGLGISLAQHEGRRITRAVSLGPEWDTVTDHALVDVAALLEQVYLRIEDLRNLLGEEAITQLALLCKTRGQLGVLRDLVRQHKRQEVIVRLEDRHGASKIMEQMQSDAFGPEEKAQLMEQLRSAHAANRQTYLALKDSPSEESRLAHEINRLIDRGLAVIAGFEKSSYTADILNRRSNRAMRSNVVSAVEGAMHLGALDLSDQIEAFRGTCSVCCGEEQIMSVVLKRLDTVEENTTDFALNFPLAAAQGKQNTDMVSSQCICFQCALLCQRSIYKEDIVAIIPTIDYHGVNMKYVSNQLTLAITAGLATGTSGMVQLFMTILDRTLETKHWCSRHHTKDSEVVLRRKVLDWMLQNLLRRCKCREDFTETGQWVDYSQALAWAIKDYESAGLDSWIMQYPLAGFSQLIRWFELLGLPEISEDRIRTVREAKLIHHVTSNIMSSLLREENGDKSWTHPFLQLIYQDFNAPGVPREGTESVISADEFWFKLPNALGQWQDVKRFLTFFEGKADQKARAALAARVQLVIFWALYTQKGHTTPKTFFAKIKSREPLALAILDPKATVPQQAVEEILRSVFCPDTHIRASQDAHLSKFMPPFVTPFGPSVLKCGLPSCPVVFYSKDDGGAEAAADGIRARRAKHFQDVYGSDPAFDSQTGLPDPTKAPKAPTSYHNTLHISTARTWSTLDYDRKQAVARGVSKDDDPAVEAFVRDTQLEICARNHRGNIYSATIEAEVRTILPSFLDALRVAIEKTGLEDWLSYVHDWRKNTIVDKMEYELSL